MARVTETINLSGPDIQMWPERNYVILHRYLLAIATRWLQISYHHYSFCVINAYATRREWYRMNWWTVELMRERETGKIYSHVRGSVSEWERLLYVWNCMRNDEMWPEKVFTVRHLHLLSVEPQKKKKKLTAFFHLSFFHLFLYSDDKLFISLELY